MILRFSSGISSVLAALILVIAQSAAEPASVNIVAIGASNTWGWGVRRAYPEHLEALLRADGYNARVINAGIILDTTAGMLNRIDAAVADGTQIVILQPGSNDLRFFRTKEQRAANIDAIVNRLRTRNIHVIVYDPVFPPDYYQWDRIHITAESHAKIASELLPQVIGIIGPATSVLSPVYPQ